MVYHRLRVRSATRAKVFSPWGCRGQGALLDPGGSAAGAVISVGERHAQLGSVSDFRVLTLGDSAMRRVYLSSAILVLVMGSLANHTRAASITWVSPQQISGDSDVMTNGTLDRAYGFGVSGDTVNGVTFGSTTFRRTQPTSADEINNGTFGFGPLSGPYANLVSNGIYDNDSGSITLNGLV